MKKKDLVFLVISVVIFLVAGYIAYTQLVPQNQAASGKGVQVEVVTVIPSSLDGEAKNQLLDMTRVQDFNSPVDLSNLGNKAPFGR